MIVLFAAPVFQETRIRASEKDLHSKVQNICISNQYGGEEVTHTLTTDSREDTHRWMEAFWQHFYDMSKYLLCCNTVCVCVWYKPTTYGHPWYYSCIKHSSSRSSIVAWSLSQFAKDIFLSLIYRPVETVLWWLNENWTAITKETSSCHTKTGLPLPWNG